MVRTRARYIGKSLTGDHRTAMVEAYGDGWVYAQFDDWTNLRFEHGWHKFPQSDFENIDGYPPLPECEDAQGDNVPQKGKIWYDNRVGSPQRDVRNTSRLERRLMRTRELAQGYGSQMPPFSVESNTPSRVEFTLSEVRPQDNEIERRRRDFSQEVANRSMEMSMQYLYESMLMSDEELAS